MTSRIDRSQISIARDARIDRAARPPWPPGVEIRRSRCYQIPNHSMLTHTVLHVLSCTCLYIPNNTCRELIVVNRRRHCNRHHDVTQSQNNATPYGQTSVYSPGYDTHDDGDHVRVRRGLRRVSPRPPMDPWTTRDSREHILTNRDPVDHEGVGVTPPLYQRTSCRRTTDRVYR